MVTCPAIDLVYAHTAQLVAVCFMTFWLAVGPEPHVAVLIVPLTGQALAASFAMVEVYVAA